MYKILVMCIMALVITTGESFAKASIGVLDMQKIAAESEPTKSAMATMQAKYGKQRDALNEQAKNLQAKEQSLSAQFATLSKDALKARQTEFLSLQRDLNQKSRTFAMNVEQDEIKIKQDVFKLVSQASATVAKRKGMDYVVDIAAAGLLFYNKKMLITDDVIAEVNKLWKAQKK